MLRSYFIFAFGTILGISIGIFATATLKSYVSASTTLNTPSEVTLPAKTELAVPATNPENTTTPIVVDGQINVVAPNEFIVANQPAGSEVVGMITHQQARTSWLVVHALTESRTLGDILGAVYVSEGAPASNFKVPLLKPTNPRISYAVVQYNDDGDMRFTVGKDTIRTTEEQSILYTLFTAQ